MNKKHVDKDRLKKAHQKSLDMMKKWREDPKNADKIKAHARKFYKSNPDSGRERHLQTNYGISIEQYDKILSDQEYCCMICRIPQSSLKRRFHVDHCHTTNIVRGLLCGECNKLLGNARENIKILESAIQYLINSL